MDTTKILSTFRLVASEFIDVDDEKVNSMIELQGVRISQKAFGDKYDLAVAYLTAHAFKLDEILKGIVTGKQIGRASCRERVSSPV